MKKDVVVVVVKTTTTVMMVVVVVVVVVTTTMCVWSLVRTTAVTGKVRRLGWGGRRRAKWRDKAKRTVNNLDQHSIPVIIGSPSPLSKHHHCRLCTMPSAA